MTPAEGLKFRSAVLYELALMDHAGGWVQQFHLGALRNNNTRMMRTLGPDTGYDSIGDFEMARPLAKFLDRLDTDDRLAKTILYNVNPRDNELFATMIGNFQDGSAAGKIQYGSAWWFLDQADGMTKQIEALSNMGLLSQFVGMLTDSRSFLSYPRHEYFRRLLCNILGAEMERGLVPNDMELVGGMVRDICYRNAARYFPFAAPGGKKTRRNAEKKPGKGRKSESPLRPRREGGDRHRGEHRARRGDGRRAGGGRRRRPAGRPQSGRRDGCGRQGGGAARGNGDGGPRRRKALRPSWSRPR